MKVWTTNRFSIFYVHNDQYQAMAILITVIGDHISLSMAQCPFAYFPSDLISCLKSFVSCSQKISPQSPLSLFVDIVLWCTMSECWCVCFSGFAGKMMLYDWLCALFPSLKRISCVTCCRRLVLTEFEFVKKFSYKFDNLQSRELLPM